MTAAILINTPHFSILEGERMGKKGRPAGLNQAKYYAVLSILRTPTSFNHLAQILAGRVSRLTISRILKDALARGAVAVNYRGKLAFYGLSEHGHALTNQIVFGVWWRLGRPRLDGEMGLDQLQSDIYSVFLLDQYPTMRVEMRREECPELFMKLAFSPLQPEARLIDLYRSLSRRIVDYERQLEAKIRAGHDPMEINRWIMEREVAGWPEDIILHRVSGTLEAGLACLKCFRKGRIREMMKKEDYYECPICRWKTERPQNFLEEEFREWLREFEESGTPLKVNRLLIYPPRIKAGLR
jgi:hypothetical protein